MTPLRQKMIDDMKLRRLADATIHAYTYNVEKFSCYFKTSPENLTLDHVREYLLYLMNERRCAPLTINQNINSIRFLWVHTLHREWDIKQSIRQRQPRKLPVILNHDEIDRMFNAIKNRKDQIAFSLCYCCGLRLQELMSIKVADIDFERTALHIHNGKGAKDRIVPIPGSLLKPLKIYITWQKASDYLFPSPHDSTKPLTGDSFQRFFSKLRVSCKILKEISPHSLRHTYATNLLENGVPLLAIQKLLGHKNIHTTLKYLHLTTNIEDHTQAVIEHLNPYNAKQSSSGVI